MRQIFLDTETTGLSPEAGDRVIEIGCVEMRSRRLTGEHRHYYLNPERANSPDAVRIHGLTDEFLADKPLFASIADELLEYVRGAEVIIHNASFDIGFLDAELRRLGRPPFAQAVARVTDSLQMARETFPGKSNSLDALCRRLEVDNTGRSVHGALLDAGLLAQVYIRLTRGQNNLVIDAGPAAGEGPQLQGIDLSSFALPVIVATADEREAHDAVLAQVAKACGGIPVWAAMAQSASSSGG